MNLIDQVLEYQKSCLKSIESYKSDFVKFNENIENFLNERYVSIKDSNEQMRLIENVKSHLSIEKQLLEILPTKYLKKAHHLILLHGRYICKSRNPLCSKCIINRICLYKDKNV